jgi:hypothetical protein
MISLEYGSEVTPPWPGLRSKATCHSVRFAGGDVEAL